MRDEHVDFCPKLIRITTECRRNSRKGYPSNAGQRPVALVSPSDLAMVKRRARHFFTGGKNGLILLLVVLILLFGGGGFYLGLHTIIMAGDAARY
jgi:hypothetical protein